MQEKWFHRSVHLASLVVMVGWIVWTVGCAGRPTANNNNNTTEGGNNNQSGNEKVSVVQDGSGADNNHQTGNDQTNPPPDTPNPRDDNNTSNDGSSQGTDDGSTKDGNSQNPDQSTNHPDKNNQQPDSPNRPDQKPDGNNQQPDGQQNADHGSQNPDDDIQIPNPPSPFPPAGSDFQPQLLNVDSFWRFMPGTLYRPIVITAMVDVHNKGSQAVQGLKVEAKLYLTGGLSSKYIELDVSTPSLGGNVAPGARQTVSFNGSTMDHGLPRYQSPQEICGKYYIAVIRFSYTQGGKAHSFEEMWRRVPFGCNCYGSQQCP